MNCYLLVIFWFNMIPTFILRRFFKFSGKIECVFLIFPTLLRFTQPRPNGLFLDTLECFKHMTSLSIQLHVEDKYSHLIVKYSYINIYNNFFFWMNYYLFIIFWFHVILTIILKDFTTIVLATLCVCVFIILSTLLFCFIQPCSNGLTNEW